MKPLANCNVKVPTAIDKANACWDQSQMLFDLVEKVLIDVIAKNPSLLTHVKGVTDGSNVQPGYVGEYQEWQVSFPIPTTWNWSQGVVVTTLPPGDWLLTSLITVNVPVAGISAYVNPVFAGLSNQMNLILGVAASTSVGAVQVFDLPSGVARACVSVPTQISFLVQTNFIGTSGTQPPTAGTGTILLAARRTR